MHKRFCTLHAHAYIHCTSNNVTTVRHLRRQCQNHGSCSGRTPCARTNVDENVEALPERYAPRYSGLAGASEWCRMVRCTAHSCSSRFSRESTFMWASVLSPASVEGVCGGSHAHGNCTIVLRLTRGHRKSGDDSEWRRELALSPPRAGLHQRLILTSDMTPIANVWGTHWTFDVKLQDTTVTLDNNWDNTHVVFLLLISRSPRRCHLYRAAVQGVVVQLISTHDEISQGS